MYLALPSCPQSGHSSLIGNTLRSILPSIISKTIMARDGKCSVHRNPSLAISVSALGLPIVREMHIRGSLIPQAINRLGEVANALQAGEYGNVHITTLFCNLRYYSSSDLLSFTNHPISILFTANSFQHTNPFQIRNLTFGCSVR